MDSNPAEVPTEKQSRAQTRSQTRAQQEAQKSRVTATAKNGAAKPTAVTTPVPPAPAKAVAYGPYGPVDSWNAIHGMSHEECMRIVAEQEKHEKEAAPTQTNNVRVVGAAAKARIPMPTASPVGDLTGDGMRPQRWLPS